jgi:hypothetical protein
VFSAVFGTLSGFGVQLKRARLCARRDRWRNLRHRLELIGVIVELPLVTAAEIAAEYRPGGEVTVKATVRRLRERELISAGVADNPRGAAGRVAGAWHVYSALNLDAARAARGHDEAAAKAIAKTAARIESHRATVEFVRRLSELGGSASLRRRLEWASSLDAELRKALVAVVSETVAERNRLVHDPTSVPRLALVAALHGEVAELMLEGAERPVSIPIPDLQLLDSAFVGAALALRFERIGVGQTLLKALPAIKLDDAHDSRIYPYERPLPDADTPIALASAVAAAPTMRRPSRIPIAGPR